MTKKIGTVQQVFPTPISIPDPGETRLPPRETPYRWDKLDLNAHIRTGVNTCFGEYSPNPVLHLLPFDSRLKRD